jgi:alpha-D-ribose 1-methylphosphonate 5-triphosphate synthase subunit PhnH
MSGLAGPVAGFAEPALAAQATFRLALDAMARPGQVAALPADLLQPPAPLQLAAYALALTLLDYETPLWLAPSLAGAVVIESLRLHCGCPIVAEPAAAAFALVDAAAPPPLAAFAQGTSDYPDRSTTLILQTAGLASGTGLTLRGPGIAAVAKLNVAGLAPGFWQQWAANGRRYPQGVDLLLTDGARLAALPRTTQVEA